ncbi:hypothetical protein [Sulfobacillus harzensis]|uniref:Orc1-like AAA ATPase domain-containing protein n=1 Tax=Sulfobacillus harzensis TaxID=2729629 RepID=A0A7Y0Q5Q3_9FIRM|nr:hypothetical protein [Sulfobacillus harzensis]NMP24544.1 hypothetical protein [Sulfobacillus harzensis]
MQPLSEHIADDRSQLFVGRQNECDWVRTWLRSFDPPTQIVAITGMGGVGKSTLLARLLEIGQTHHAITVWIDARTCYRTPRRFLESLPDRFQHWQRMTGPRPPLMLAIDNYEELDVLETWLKEVFLPGLPATGVLLLLASRPNVYAPWVLDPGWQRRVHLWPLGDFSPEETEDYLSRRQWPANDLAVARRLAERHPLSLAVLSEARRRRPSTNPLELEALVRESLSVRLLREVTDPDLEPLVEALSLLRDADLTRLERVLETRISPRRYAALKRLSFVKRTAINTVSLHDLAVTHLFRDFQQRDPKRLDHLRHRAVQVLLDEWDQSDAGKRGALAQHLLWVCRDVLQEGTHYADLTDAAPELEVSGYRASDYPWLRTLIAAWPRQSLPLAPPEALALFDIIADQFPSAIRVTREASGRPVAVFVALPLYDRTLELIRAFHPVVADRLLAFDHAIGHSGSEDANTLFNVLSGFDFQQKRYTAETLLGVVARDQLSFQVGVLGLLILTNPDLKAFLRRLGYQSQPFPVSHPPVADEELFILDLRHQHFGAWIQSLLRQLRPTHPGIRVEDVRYVLDHWSDARKLGAGALAQRLQLPAEDLRQLIQEGLAADPPAPLTARDARVLQETFFSGDRTVWQHAERLHVSRATYYRYLEKSLTHLATWLESKMRRF